MQQQQAPAATAPAPARFDALQQFNTLVSQQTAGWSVSAASNKNSLKIGKDSLGFTLSSAKAGYVNVLLLGPDGSLLQLFPNDKAKDNHVAAGQTLKLPGASWPLEASDPFGTEHFIVLVSETQRDYSMLSRARLPLPQAAHRRPGRSLHGRLEPPDAAAARRAGRRLPGAGL